MNTVTKEQAEISPGSKWGWKLLYYPLKTVRKAAYCNISEFFVSPTLPTYSLCISVNLLLQLMSNYLML